MAIKKYKTIVLGLELEAKSDKWIIQRAKEFVEQFGSRLILVHCVEYFNSFGTAYGVVPGVDVEQTLINEASKILDKVGKNLGVKKNNQFVYVGSAKQVIVEKAKQVKADLIIVGSHGKSGFRLLLGSTANGVLHAAHCDVLAVRVNKKVK